MEVCKDQCWGDSWQQCFEESRERILEASLTAVDAFAIPIATPPSGHGCATLAAHPEHGDCSRAHLELVEELPPFRAKRP